MRPEFKERLQIVACEHAKVLSQFPISNSPVGTGFFFNLFLTLEQLRELHAKQGVKGLAELALSTLFPVLPPKAFNPKDLKETHSWLYRTTRTGIEPAIDRTVGGHRYVTGVKIVGVTEGRYEAVPKQHGTVKPFNQKQIAVFPHCIRIPVEETAVNS